MDAINKEKDREKEKLKQLRKMAEEKINDFVNNSQESRLQFEPMEQLYRNVIRDIAEDAGVISYSFGIEGEDRYVMLFKKQNPPSEDELATLRAGEEWNEDKAKEIAQKRKLEKLQEEDRQKVSLPKNFKPAHNYKEKYQHIIGLESAKEAAKKTETNKQYGFVPSANKKDQRSIEQTLADIRKKKMKLSHNPECSTSE
ncbi:sperm-associated antigen 7 [Diaphorina citri]|uniref:Sperm-associated antigen 7 n=1 Tax=Diaphorina citri TaxID=121845 RepID=A0A1S3DU14_DIACI|nr:sperm-associated antigen 7 [Diaphorina citri]